MKWMQLLRRTILVAVLIALARPIVAQDRIAWITDLRQARDMAERNHRLVLLHFWSETCLLCKQVERNVFHQPEFIRALTTGYVPVKINANEQPQLAKFYNIDRVPTDVIVTAQGREVQRFQSLQDPNRYIAMLDGIRAQAGVGAYEPVTSNAPPAATRPQQETADTSPLGQQSTPQLQSLAPRYANPYGQGASTPSNTAGSRWSQPTQGSGSNDTNREQRTSSLQSNRFVGPSATGDAGPAPSSLALQQNRPTAQGRFAQNNGPQNQGVQNQPVQNQPVQNQPVQNPAVGGSAARPGQDLGGLGQQPPRQSQPNSNQPQISLEGYCPVTLVQNRVWAPGDKKWGAVHEGRVYLFAGPEQQKVFLANPEIYAPLMAGYDPVRFAETGQLVPGLREFGLYVADPGPMALFADEGALQRFHSNSDYYFNVVAQAKLQQSGRAIR